MTKARASAARGRPNQRFPAEWEAQDAVVIAWPHAETDWAPWLISVEQSYVELARAILQRAKLVLLVADRDLEQRALRLIDRSHDLETGRILVTRFDYDDTWLRDSGPISLVNDQAVGAGSNQTGSSSAERGSPNMTWLDFRFTGWGGKYGASRDDQIVAHLHRLPTFQNINRVEIPFALEGGAIESDGAGTLLSTWNCLQKRHPDQSRADVEALLISKLAVQRVLCLEHGELDGDDTDAHIDTLARFASIDCITYQACDDARDPHYSSLQNMAQELASLKQLNGKAYRLVPLPWAGDIRDSEGRRLAASYANFLILNGAVLMPAYGVDTDVPAAMALAEAFPNHEIMSVPARPFIEQNGSVHCLTMQLPKGVWP
jgi:agmatine/peptidylarginine deiminase